MVASAVFGLPICDATKGTSAACVFDVVSGALEEEPGTPTPLAKPQKLFAGQWH